MPINVYLALAAILFGIGAYGILTRRNILTILMGMEVMLNAVNLMLVAFNRNWGLARMMPPFQSASETMEGMVGAPVGQIFVIFSLTIAVAEAAIGFALVYYLFRGLGTVDASKVNLMKW
ncbi:NADH-quinone oxidoreductase subunit NuoK [bacterium]|nr:NADH-quinone oxidoreductase subunit NuoK [bacterium]